MPLWLKVTFSFIALLFASALAFAVFEPIQVLPRMRLAPGYAMTAADGSIVTSEDLRGTLVVYSFEAAVCDTECDQRRQTTAAIQKAIEGDPTFEDVVVNIVTVVVDGASTGYTWVSPPQATVRPLKAPSLSVPVDAPTDRVAWSFLGIDPELSNAIVGHGFRRSVTYDDAGSAVRYDSGYVIVDPVGTIRGDYRYATLNSDDKKIPEHLSILVQELHNSSGASTAAYEAAHLFLCYP